MCIRDRGGVVLAICGGYQLLGNYYKVGDETIEGLGVVNIYTEHGDSRLIGNIVLQSDLFPLPIVGFENHGGRTYIAVSYTHLDVYKRQQVVPRA